MARTNQGPRPYWVIIEFREPHSYQEGSKGWYIQYGSFQKKEADSQHKLEYKGPGKITKVVKTTDADERLRGKGWWGATP